MGKEISLEFNLTFLSCPIWHYTSICSHFLNSQQIFRLMFSFLNKMKAPWCYCYVMGLKWVKIECKKTNLFRRLRKATKQSSFEPYLFNVIIFIKTITRRLSLTSTLFFCSYEAAIFFSFRWQNCDVIVKQGNYRSKRVLCLIWLVQSSSTTQELYQQFVWLCTRVSGISVHLFVSQSFPSTIHLRFKFPKLNSRTKKLSHKLGKKGYETQGPWSRGGGEGRGGGGVEGTCPPIFLEI